MDANAIENARLAALNTGGSSGPIDPPKAAPPSSPPPNKPEGDSVNLSDFAKEQVETGKGNNEDFQRELSVASNNQVVMKLIDPETRDVVRQLPPEEQLRLREAMRNAAEDFNVE